MGSQPDRQSPVGSARRRVSDSTRFRTPEAVSYTHLDVYKRQDEYVLNPTKAQLEETALDLVVAATETAVMMVESEAKELSEEIMLGAVVYGHEQMQAVIKMISELAAEAGKDAWDWVAPEPDTALIEKVAALAAADINAAFQIKAKGARSTKLSEITNRVLAELITEETSTTEANKIKNEKMCIRDRIKAKQLSLERILE